MFKTKPSRLDPATAEAVFGSNDVARIAGITLRQLQWWDEKKVVSPNQDGHKRLYVAHEVVEIAVIAELRRKGLPLQKIRRILRFLDREMSKRLAGVFKGEAELHLLTDGKTAHFEGDHDSIINLLKRAKQPMFLVCVSDLVQRMDITNA
ncbi:MAG: MerR family transcriptional regulator [Bryobacterales bacterium]|nr:MerR family transcriptional regulator [Bryobacterales bacterium]